jgi:hypothetical protein
LADHTLPAVLATSFMSDFDRRSASSRFLQAAFSGAEGLPSAELIQPERRRIWLHGLLFLATVFTTTVVGAQLQSSFAANLPPFSASFFELGWLFKQPSRLWLGLPFSATLLLILLAHEMGHYIACLRYRVSATLPFFIPAPTLIGTFGAFIRIKSPIPSRKALFDIGVAGPIAGFLVALPALALGLNLSKLAPSAAVAPELQLGYPAVFEFVFRIAGGPHVAASSQLQDLCLHPVAIAAWVGMFATMLNLLPGGQLDGGHILYALWPRLHKTISYVTVASLLLMGLLPALWAGWLLWAGILLVFGTRHPLVPLSPSLDGKRKWLACVALLIFALTFMPAPIQNNGVDWQATGRTIRSWLHL